MMNTDLMIAGAVAGALALVIYTTSTVRGEMDNAICRTQISNLQRSAAEQAASAMAAERAYYASETARGDRLAAQLLDQSRVLDSQRDQLKRAINHVTTVYRPTPDAAPVALPAAVYTAGFVRLWNTATGTASGIAVPAARATAIGTAASTCPAQTASQPCADDLIPGGLNPDDLAATTLTSADVLDNHIDNSTACLRNTAQLEQLIAWHHGGQEVQP